MISSKCLSAASLICLIIWLEMNSSNTIFSAAWFSSIFSSTDVLNIDFFVNSRVADLLICALLYFACEILQRIQPIFESTVAPVFAPVDSTKCKQCGDELRPYNKFCVSCGIKIEEKIAKCNQCGNELRAGNKFCVSCGNRIAEENDSTLNIRQTVERVEFKHVSSSRGLIIALLIIISGVIITFGMRSLVVEPPSAAQASNIVSNLRSLQPASLMFFADYKDIMLSDEPPTTIVIHGNEIALLPKPDLALLTAYTSNPQAAIWTAYDFEFTGDGPIAERTWWVSTRVTGHGTRDRLAARAHGVGLFSAPRAPDNIGVPDYDGTTERVFILIRNPVEGFLSLCISGTAQQIEATIRGGANVNARGSGGNTALMLAARTNTPEAVSMLLRNGADVNAQNSPPNFNWTPLMYAAQRNQNQEVLSILIQAGADVNFMCRNNWNPLRLAARFNANPQIISVLLEAGANIDAREGRKTALMWAAAENRNPQVVATLLDAGADVHIVCRDDNKRAIDYAGENSELRNTPVYQRLLAASSEPARTIEPPVRVARVRLGVYSLDNEYRGVLGQLEPVFSICTILPDMP